MTNHTSPRTTMPNLPSHGLIALNQADHWLKDAKSIAIIAGVALQDQKLTDARQKEMARLISIIASKLDDAIENIKFASEGME